MKNLFIIILFSVYLSMFSLVSADGYPEYMNDDKNFILAGGHMGVGWYLDKTSITFEQYEYPYIVIAANMITVEDADRGNTESNSIETCLYGYDVSLKKMYKFRNRKWIFLPPVGSLAEKGHEYGAEMVFYILYREKFYGNQVWYDKKTGRYEQYLPDSFYARIDNGK